MKILHKQSDLDKAIAKIGKASKNLSDNIQQAAASAVVHAILHGNATNALNLFMACGRIVDRPTMIRWFDKYAVELSFDKAATTFNVKIKTKNMADLRAKYDADKDGMERTILGDRIDEHGADPAKIKPLDVPALISALAKRARKEHDEDTGKIDKAHSNFAGLVQLEQLAVSLMKAAPAGNS